MLQTSDISKSCHHSTHSVDEKQRVLGLGCSRILSLVAFIGLWSFYGGNDLAWGDVVTADKKAIVAAGFGYQIGSVSAISVKVYEADSGAIVSDDVYELTVKEGDGAGRNEGARIFAGGIGQGATDLSNFVLRVYDANTGIFQWEGRLNLVQPDGKGRGQIISTRKFGHATITRVRTERQATEQPKFLLRAVDAVTGSLVWEDEFTTVLGETPHLHSIADRSTMLGRVSANSSHRFEFIIRMYDPSGKKIIWEDQLSQRESEEGAQGALNDQADLLPVWPHQPQDESIPLPI
ncbi:MAG: hypothetical protein IPP12_02290 [Nitrospira sp.]|nr:hypothetical protein [Nitrospira sp.]MBK9946004.1 hypothetical protein [Nitrospira sp.]